MGATHRREPRSGRASSLVLLLHGYGANGQDLISLAEMWSPRLPTTAFVAPDAPQPVPGTGGAFQWFPLQKLDASELWSGVRAAQPGLEAMIVGELKRYQLAPRRLAIVGFSQGTMMALHIAMRMAEAPAAVVGFSGVIAGGEQLIEDVRGRPPVQLIHGTEDDLIPVDALHLTREALGEAQVPVEWHIREGLGHGIDQAGIALADSFLRQHLAKLSP